MKPSALDVRILGKRTARRFAAIAPGTPWTSKKLIEAMAKELDKAVAFAEGRGNNQAGAWDTLAKEAREFLKGMGCATRSR